MSDRYAVYLAPAPDSALWRFGSRVLGRDAVTGASLFGFAPDGFTADAWRDLTEEPRHYGFHATLKAPFRLKEGLDLEGLEAAVAAIADTTPAFDLGPLQISVVTTGSGGFVALTPHDPTRSLFDLEARALRELDRFRAPPTQAELSRRRPDRLTPRQRELLRDFGYPYVLEEFRPHFTLCGAIQAVGPIAERLAQGFATSGAEPTFRVEALYIFAQREGSPFTVTGRFPMK